MVKKQTEKKDIAQMVDAGELIVPDAILDVDRMPPILAGQSTTKMVNRVERFYFSIGEILELWLKRRPSEHTQRAYRQDVMALIDYLGFDWPKDSTELLTVSVADVLEWRDALEAEGKAPKTLNRRISSVSSFYKYLLKRTNLPRLPFVKKAKSTARLG